MTPASTGIRPAEDRSQIRGRTDHPAFERTLVAHGQEIPAVTCRERLVGLGVEDPLTGPPGPPLRLARPNLDRRPGRRATGHRRRRRERVVEFGVPPSPDVVGDVRTRERHLLADRSLQGLVAGAGIPHYCTSRPNALAVSALVPVDDVIEVVDDPCHNVTSGVGARQPLACFAVIEMRHDVLSVGGVDGKCVLNTERVVP